MAITPKNICLNVLADLGALITSDPTTANLNPNGTLAALKSPINAVGINDLRVQRLGKKFDIHVKFYPKHCGEVTEGVPSACSFEDTSTNEVDYFKVSGDKYFARQYKFDKDEYRTICESWGDVVNATDPINLSNRNLTVTRKLLSMAQDILDHENMFYYAELIAKASNYADGTSSVPGAGTEKTLNLFDTAARPNAMGLFPVKKNYSRMGYQSTQFIAVGGSSIEAWADASNIYRGNVDGLDPNRVGGILPYIDYKGAEFAADALGDTNERMLTWIPSHNQAIQYLRNEGAFATARPTLLETTINLLGEQFDLSIHTPDCGDIILTLGRGNALFNINDVSVANCGGQPSLLNWVVDCGALTCDTVKQEIAQGS